MKTIAMTIDEPTLERIDRLTASNAAWKSRSEVIRQAVHRFVAELDRADEEAHEHEVFRRNRVRLARQAVALIDEQAKP
jgi:Arc/MetJ-type ribon-helix-helix transcriptional regulator